MRSVLLIALTIVGISSAHAQTARVDRFDKIKPGIIKADKVTTKQDDNISTGKIVQTHGAKVVEVTNKVTAADGTRFGVEFVSIGSPKGRKATVKILWRYPQPGLKSPDTGTTKFTDEYEDTITIGTREQFHWTLGDEWTRVPGTWTLEVSQNDRKLLSQDFILTKP